MKTLSERLKHAMERLDITQAELVKATGISKGALSSYINGRYEPKQKAIYELAKALNVNEAWLMGYDVPMDRSLESNSSFASNVFPIDKIKLPMLGSIACGEPIFASEDRESYVLAGTDIRADFCLKASGDSMINARINDGDIVFIRKQEIVNNGEIAAVIIDDTATLKRFYYYKKQGMIILRSENPKFEDIILSGSDLENVRVLGKAIAFQSDVE